MSTLSHTLLSKDDTQLLFILFILSSVISMESVLHKNMLKNAWDSLSGITRLVRTVLGHLEAVFLAVCNPSMNEL